jgi:predicted N-acetyltransferase YhbS
MERIIKTADEKYYEVSEIFVEKVFTASEDAESGKLVRSLLHEIRSKKYYVPELDLIMVDENDEVIGLAVFSRFHIEGRYEDELVILTPVAVKTELQRQHISKDIIEFGLKRAAELGYKAAVVEGNPMNYRPRGFKTSADFGIFPHESVGLPAPECLMVQELVPGGLEGIHGELDYRFYDALR